MARVAGRLAGLGERDDVLQNAVAVAWRKRRAYDPSRGEARAWLLAITADQARKSWRAQRHLLDSGTHAQLDIRTADPNPAEQVLDLRRAVDQLSARQRVAVSLFYYCDLPIADVAAVMGCAEGTVKSTLADARNALRSALGKDYR